MDEQPNNQPKVLLVVAAAIKSAEDGIVYSVPAPGRHHNVIHMLAQAGFKPPVLGEQGFLLSDGRFATRTAAKYVARKAGQLLERASELKQLFSEDVW